MEYKIIIEAKDLKSKNSPISGDEKKSDTKQKEEFSAGDLLKTIKGSIAYNTVKSYATQIINHQVSLVQLKTGSNELQGRANFINNHVQSGLGLIGGVAFGFATGNPLIAGASILQAGTSMVNSLIGISQRQQMLNIENAIENISLNAQFIRAGSNGSRGGK